MWVERNKLVFFSVNLPDSCGAEDSPEAPAGKRSWTAGSGE